MRCDGLVIVLGKVELESRAVINGGLIVVPGLGDYDDHGDDGGDGELEVEVESKSRIQYSSHVLRQIDFLIPGKFQLLNGWQAVSAY